MGWDYIVRMAGAAAIVLFVVSIFTPAANIAAAAIAVDPALEASGAIVVLGAGSGSDGTLSDSSLRRAVYGMQLYKRGLAPWIIFSGASSFGGPSESSVRAAIARDLGIPADVILETSNVHTTRDESLEVASLLAERNVGEILLVTGALHMRRSILAFEAAGLRVHPAPAESWYRTASTAQQRLELVEEILRESVAILYYRLAAFV